MSPACLFLASPALFQPEYLGCLAKPLLLEILPACPSRQVEVVYLCPVQMAWSEPLVRARQCQEVVPQVFLGRRVGLAVCLLQVP